MCQELKEEKGHIGSTNEEWVSCIHITHLSVARIHIYDLNVIPFGHQGFSVFLAIDKKNVLLSIRTLERVLI